MKLHTLTTITCAFALFCGTALAQNLIDASTLDGKKVTNPQGEDLANISQLLVDPQSGQVRYAVLELNKLWKINDPEVAVPFGALKITGKPSDANFKVTLDATKEKLSNAPKHKIGEADRLYTKDASAPIYSYWSIVWFEPVPASTPAKSGDNAKKSSGTSSGASDSTSTGTGTTGTGTSGTGTPGTTGSSTTGGKK